MSEPTTAAELIAAERQRHAAEGYTDEHDDRYLRDELVRAAICYAYPPAFRQEVPMKPGDLGEGWVACSTREALYFCPEIWPWSPELWRPTRDRKKELVKAAALIAAEIDRMLRVQGNR